MVCLMGWGIRYPGTKMEVSEKVFICIHTEKVPQGIKLLKCS